MSERIIAIDASCACGAKLIGAWSGEEVDEWQESHEHDEESEDE